MNKKISIVIILIVVLINLIPIKSNAVTPIDTAYVYANKKTDALLIWNDMGIHTHMAVYKKDGKEYPAYCMNRELSGVEIGFSQTVDVNKLINNVMIWRVIINGYPYKTISELGCKTEGEAYLATKQAVYCVLTNRDVNEYTAIGEAGERTLNALKKILKNAKNSSATKVSSDFIIKQDNSMWKEDSIDNKYVSQTFTVSANASFSEYEISLKNLNLEGVKITDKDNKVKRKFNSGEKFKILIPTTNITKDGSFEIAVSGRVETKPVFYGESRDSNLQSYALTGYTYEDGTGSKKIYYSKNETKIIITKKDGESSNVLKGVKFDLLDENQKTIYTDLVTDKNGQIIIDNLIPGIYYIKETKTLGGYELYNKTIKVDLELNEEANIDVINSKEEPSIEKKKTKTEKTVKNTKSKTKIKLPKTGM